MKIPTLDFIAYQTYLNYYYRKILSTNIKVILGAILLLALLVGLFRACSSPGHVNHIFTIARDTTWYPLQFYDKETSVTAFTNELLTEIAKREHLGIQLLQTPTSGLLEGLSHDEYDAILTTLPPNFNNRENFEFSDPLFILKAHLIVRINSDIKSLADLKDKIVGIRSGVLAVSDYQKYPGILLTSYDNVLPALLDLDKGKIDGVVMESLPTDVYLTGLFSGKLREIELPVSSVGIRMVVKRPVEHDSHFITHINAGLKSVKADGSYQALLNKWGL